LSKGWAFDVSAFSLRGPHAVAAPSTFFLMSIAVSAVIVPSRVLRWAMLCHGLASVGAGIALALAGSRLAGLQWGAALACMLAGAALLCSPAPGRNVRRIDISGVGQLRLTVQQGVGQAGARAGVMHLLPGSTVWPGLLLLRLRGDDGKHCALVLLPDSVAAGRFRRLAVAIRDVAARKE
jgi:toxin CptA